VREFILRHPSAYLPIIMSIGALTIPWIWVLVFGPDPYGDEGGAAHIFQILAFVQIPIILYFAIRWLSESKDAFKVLTLQVLLLILAFVPVYILEH
jgi:hypothetical protein